MRRPVPRGIAYLALMIAIAIIGLVAANAVQLGSVHGQRDAEEELLFVAAEFKRALGRYAEATPAGLPRTPSNIEDLLRDPRYPGVVRHLRRAYVDPMTGQLDWVWQRDAQGRIVGLHSASDRKPLRIAGPDATPGQPRNEEATYQDWIFWGPLRPATPPPPQSPVGASGPAAGQQRR